MRQDQDRSFRAFRKLRLQLGGIYYRHGLYHALVHLSYHVFFGPVSGLFFCPRLFDIHDWLIDLYRFLQGDITREAIYVVEVVSDDIELEKRERMVP